MNQPADQAAHTFPQPSIQAGTIIAGVHIDAVYHGDKTASVRYLCCEMGRETPTVVRLSTIRGWFKRESSAGCPHCRGRLAWEARVAKTAEQIGVEAADIESDGAYHDVRRAAAAGLQEPMHLDIIQDVCFGARERPDYWPALWAQWEHAVFGGAR